MFSRLSTVKAHSLSKSTNLARIVTKKNETLKDAAV